MKDNNVIVSPSRDRYVVIEHDTEAVVASKDKYLVVEHDTDAIASSRGVQGPRGPKGDIGDQGQTIITGVLPPDETVGRNGDFYIDTVTYYFYGPKENDIWPEGFSIKPPADENPDLAAIAALTGAGILRRNGHAFWSLDLNDYLTTVDGSDVTSGIIDQKYIDSYIARTQNASFTGVTSIDGGLRANLQNKIADYTLAVTDYIINATNGPWTATLPSAVGIKGQEFVINNSDNGTITISPSADQNISGVASIMLGLNESIKIVSTGTNWIII